MRRCFWGDRPGTKDQGRKTKDGTRQTADDGRQILRADGPRSEWGSHREAAMDEARINAIVEAVLRELRGAAVPHPPSPPVLAATPHPLRFGGQARSAKSAGQERGEQGDLVLDLPDPTEAGARYRPG